MKKKFFKVYKGPGYPIDPKLELDRWESLYECVESVFVNQRPRILSFDGSGELRFQTICALTKMFKN